MPAATSISRGCRRTAHAEDGITVTKIYQPDAQRCAQALILVLDSAKKDGLVDADTPASPRDHCQGGKASQVDYTDSEHNERKTTPVDVAGDEDEEFEDWLDRRVTAEREAMVEFERRYIRPEARRLQQ
jgi:hypothetical protein